MTAENTNLDTMLKRLSQQASCWAQQDTKSRIGYLKNMRKNLEKISDEWVLMCCKAKHISPQSDLAAEDWMAGPATIFRNIRETIKTLETNYKRAPSKWLSKTNGQMAALIFPDSLFDKLMLAGLKAELWIQKGKPQSQALEFSEATHKGEVCLVLGAGNQSSIPVLDSLYQLFVENKVVFLKLNPVNAYLKPLIEVLFSSFIKDGFFAVCDGGGGVGEYLCQSDHIRSIHMTGSAQTYNQIVWKDGIPGKQKKTEKFVSAELGCVTPILVVPGQWTERQLEIQAWHVASMVTNNASFNCNAGKVLVTGRDWPQRELFLQKVKKALSDQSPRYAYYPGAGDRYKKFLEKYPNAKVVGQAGDGVVPWTLLPNIPISDKEYALQNEAFCGVLAEFSIDAATADEFLENVVDVVNDKISGTLSCCILIDDETQKNSRRIFEKALENLRYGGIGVNAWSGILYYLQSTTWGAFPGHSPENISSGIGVVHNTFMYDFPEKSIVYAPFEMHPTPLWFIGRKNHLKAARALTSFECKQTPWRFLKLALASL